MKPAMLICGYGRGISRAVALRFGQAGHPVRLVARNAHKLAEAVQQLNGYGFDAQAIPCDLGNSQALETMLERVRLNERIGILHWNAFMDVEGDLLHAQPAELLQSLNVRVVSYLATVQALLPDLAAQQGAVLATSGIMALQDAHTDDFAKDYGILAVSVTAQHKANALLARSLARQGVRLCEVVVDGFVQGTPGAEKHANALDPADIAEKFWRLYTEPKAHSQVFGE